MVCAADVMDVLGGEVGVLDADFSFADTDGIGSHWWAVVGCDGSSGGALMLLLGIDWTVAEFMTSCQLELGSRNLHHIPSSLTSFIFRQRLRKTASILFRSSIIPISSFALVGFAA